MKERMADMWWRLLNRGLDGVFVAAELVLEKPWLYRLKRRFGIGNVYVHDARG